MFDIRNMTDDQRQKLEDDAAHYGLIFNDATLLNPMSKLPEFLNDAPHLYTAWLLSQPEYLHTFVKYVIGIDLLPFQVAVIQNMWTHKFPMFIATRGGSKSSMLGLYALLRCMLIKDRKVIVVGAGFRQSKIIFDYVVKYWNDSPLLRDCYAGKENGPKNMIDMMRFNLRDGYIIAIPIGATGDKSRGLRSNDTLGDEFSSIPQEVFETVIAGFSSVKSQPAEAARTEVRNKIKRIFNIEIEPETSMANKNQLVISGTAYYQFGHFYKYWKQWKETILSRGETSKLEKIFADRGIPEGYNWKDFTVIRLPYSIIPHGFMDASNLARAKLTVNSGVFKNEYEACLNFDAKIITKSGVKNIGEIQIGEEVLTHKGYFKKVINTFKRLYNGPMIHFKSYNCWSNFYITPNHPIYNGENFILPENNNGLLYLSRLNELNHESTIDIANYTHDIFLGKDFVFPSVHTTTNIVTSEKRIEIIKLKDDGLTYKQIEQKTGVAYANIWHTIKNKNKRPKNSINRLINLDYNFGLCLGYYASEGSCGANGRALTFSLDGHINTKLSVYIDQLENAIIKTLGPKPKKYLAKDEVCNVTLNSRIAVDLFKKICPGVASTKFINHDILFSNEDLMKGFIVGIFNGDGHIRYDNEKYPNLATIQLVNLNLINQVKLVLDYFGIASSILYKEKETGYINGKLFNLKDVYKLNITGINFIRFVNIFYNTNIEESDNNNKSYAEGNNIVYKIQKQEVVEWNDYVYNIEVEDDNSYSLLNSTVHNCFSADSEGFFPRSLIDSCVVDRNKLIELQSGEVDFTASLYGKMDRKYILGLDPASESANLAIVILEIWPDHRRVVYTWTINRKEHIKKVEEKLVGENDYYAYIARKIRELMNVFPIEKIAIDWQGGGVAVIEALHNKNNLEPGENMIWPIINPDKPEPSDSEPGLHIIEKINFADTLWCGEANHGLKKDMEDKVLFFPYFDVDIIAEASFDDVSKNRKYDTFENVLTEIEELKNELCSIMLGQTPTGKDKWDTISVVHDGKKVKLHKDRYSALLMANAVARKIALSANYENQTMQGTYSKEIPKRTYSGASWLTDQLDALYEGY